MIRTVLFDFFGTVARPVDWPETPESVLARWGYALADTVRQQWARERESGVEHVEHSLGRAAYVKWERGRLAATARASGVPMPVLDAVVDEMYAARRPQRLEPYPESLEVLDRLHAGGLHLGLCSNWDWDLAELVAECGMAERFDLIVSSARARARKPHPLIYRYALEHCPGQPSTVLFVGDTPAADVVGPAAAGMKTVLVCRGEPAEWRGAGGVSPPAIEQDRAIDHTVTDLLQLLPLVEAGLRAGSA